MKRIAAALAALCLLVLPLPVFGEEDPAFTPVLSAFEGRQGDAVELSLPYDGSLGEVAAFLVRVEFDPEIVEYRRIKEASAIREACSAAIVRENWVGSGCVRTEGVSVLTGPGETFTYCFRVREDAPAKTARFRVSVYEIAGPGGERHPDVEAELTYRVLTPLSSDALLTQLAPETGRLEPEFEPGCFAYELTVPFEVSNLTFQAKAGDGAVCKVNRRTLGPGGSRTEFRFTVTAEDGKAKNVYTVSVYREEKASPSPSPSPTPSPSPSPRPTASPTPAPRPSPTPKPTVTPVPGPAAAAVSSAAEATPRPSSTPSPTPAASAAETPKPTAAPAAGSAFLSNDEWLALEATRQVAVYNGEPSLLPLLLILLIPTGAFFLSRPLAHWLWEVFSDREEAKK